MLVDGFPLARAHVERECHRGRLRRGTVISDSVVVVRIVRAARKINFLVFFRSPCRDPVARLSRMVWQFGPLNLREIVMVDLSHPASIRSDVLRFTSSRVL